MSRADIARSTHLAPPTVSDVVDELLASGLAEEIGRGTSTGGKRPTLLRVVDNARQLIGLDLAGGIFRGAILDLRGNIRQRVDLPLRDRSGASALALVDEMVGRLISLADAPLLGIGIGTPGLVDAVDGVVCRAVNVDWYNVPLRDLLYRRYGLPVHLANDSQLAALAEYTFGPRAPAGGLVVIHVGRGVGAGIIVNGQLLHGDPYGAGEIGHVVVEPDGERCQCGRYGCLETVTNCEAILRRTRSLAANAESVGGLAPGACSEAYALAGVRRLLDAGDPGAHQAVRETACYLGIAAANLVGMLGHCRILFGGSVTCLGEEILAGVREELIRRALSPIAENTEVGFVTVGADVVLRGASARVLTQELGLL